MSNNHITALAIVNYQDLKKMKAYYEQHRGGGDGHGRNSQTAPAPKVTGKELMASQINKEFNLNNNNDEEKEKESSHSQEETVVTQVVPAEKAISEAKSLIPEEGNDLASNDDDESKKSSLSSLAEDLLNKITAGPYKHKAELLFEAINLNHHPGGIFMLDNVQYEPKDLEYFIKRLYQSRKQEEHASNGKLQLFLDSLKMRKLKKYVKHKNLFVNKHWWMLH